MRSSLLLTERGIQAIARFTCPARKITGNLHFIIDTGSERSFLGWEDAEKLGLRVDALPGYPKPVLGFGGSAEAKHLREECYIYLDFGDHGLQQVLLADGILLYRPSKARTKHWKRGPSVSILGRDFLEESGYRLVVDLAATELFLEKMT